MQAISLEHLASTLLSALHALSEPSQYPGPLLNGCDFATANPKLAQCDSYSVGGFLTNDDPISAPARQFSISKYDAGTHHHYPHSVGEGLERSVFQVALEVILKNDLHFHSFGVFKVPSFPPISIPSLIHHWRHVGLLFGLFVQYWGRGPTGLSPLVIWALCAMEDSYALERRYVDAWDPVAAELLEPFFEASTLKAGEACNNRVRSLLMDNDINVSCLLRPNSYSSSYFSTQPAFPLFETAVSSCKITRMMFSILVFGVRDVWENPCFKAFRKGFNAFKSSEQVLTKVFKCCVLITT